MGEHTDSPRLSAKFAEALSYAAALHRNQTRKDSGIPYIGHLLSVAGLVIEGDGDETQAIAALLHDAAEDQGGRTTLDEIRARFGADVAAIVDECSDTFEKKKPAWQKRKQDYIDHLGEASEPTVLVSLADKLDNARAILRDFRIVGPELWQRFTVKEPELHLWYYRSLLKVYQRRSASWLVAELERVLDDLEGEIEIAPAAVDR